MYCSVHRHKIDYIFSDFNLIFDQGNSIGSGDCKEFIFKKLNLGPSNIEKRKFHLKFPKICNFQLDQYVSFQTNIFVNYKKILRNFPS